MKKKLSFLFTLLMIFTLVLSACSSGGSSEKAGSDTSKENSKEENPVKDRGNEIIVGVSAEPQNWDPIDTFLLDWSTIATSVFEGLVDRTLDLELQPGLAESWEYLDDSTLQFKLRQGVTFHNGEPFNAEAVKFTFDRLLGPEGQKGPQYSNYNTIDKVEIVDEYTVNFKLNAKDPVLLTKLAGYGAVIVPPNYIKENGDDHFNNNPVGTGPFKMTGYKRDQEIVLEKNPNYWKEGLPKLDKVTFKVIPEASTRLAELQTGKIDIMKRVEVAQAKTIKDTSFLELKEIGSPTVFAIRFDTAKKPLDNKLVRQAINYAIDKDAIIKEILGGYGYPISTFQSELSFGNNPNLKPYSYDPEKAKELLNEAGVKEGTELDFFIPGNDGNFKEIAQVVSFYLEEVGLKVNIQTADGTTMNSDLIPNGNAGHMYRNGWGGWTLDFDNTAYQMYAEGEFWNPSFKDAKVEELLAAERSTVDQAEREKIFKELTEVLYELAPEVNLYQAVDLYAANKRVQNFQPPHEDRMRLEEVSVK
ncbi:ABC transporter substrate-binding protein [Cytobacillus dafuensis]|uniref:ABC transporter substrate-binding protein n=1 Tax=Cytobacillus dafuensis TaxID=1742359 RepID=A0A5B8Z4T7_CYTDA|nr:ABC transporter substrate-binding protein [Cytobacillus dafuensis]QED46326.1 ABC transporter substrate-binding protein [Cytobacillus dafuensis]